MSYEKSAMFFTNLAFCTIYISSILDNITLYSLTKIGLKKLISTEVTDMKISSQCFYHIFQAKTE